MLYEVTITVLEISNEPSIEVQMIKQCSVIYNFSCDLRYYKNMNNWATLKVQKR